jgi:hypothetical protein
MGFQESLVAMPTRSNRLSFEGSPFCSSVFRNRPEYVFKKPSKARCCLIVRGGALFQKMGAQSSNVYGRKSRNASRATYRVH